MTSQATAPVPPVGASPVSDLHPALIALVRLLARQAVREWLYCAATTEVVDTDAHSRPFAMSEDKRG
jgi:hypothetical protein